MIKAHELRIGNHVYLTNDNGETYIDQIDAIDIYDCWVSPEKFNQSRKFIPITEELLVKAGFKVLESSVCKQFYIGINPVTKDWLLDLVWLEKPELIGAPNVPFYRNGYHEIHFVHQLQNLYFALTGEELIFEGLNQ
jgi:hypothetical protein